MGSAPHYSVMLPEVLSAMAPADGEVYVDGTLGAGGYTQALLDQADCTVVAIDRDEVALAIAKERLKDYEGRVYFVHGRFADVASHLAQLGFSRVDGFVVDLGVSSMQLDQANRGFSFRFDGPLDMRMDQSGEGQTAADVVNTYDETDIANIIYKYGEERKSRHVARAIVSRRAERLFERTSDLADVVRGAIFSSPKDKIDPATRTFQGLRIYVNKELEELEKALDASVDILSPGGRLVVVSFHSLEDRIVKHFLLDRSGQRSRGSRHMPDLTPDEPAVFSLPSKKAVFPSDDEVADNARSRSARLRYAIRTEAAI